jgi:MoaA/NifB/PqqE/SkfB family radical SAM enzyme
MQRWYMDPYIDCEALDPRHPLTRLKLDNYARGDAAHRQRAAVVDALPVKLTVQTTDACNLDCPHCQIPRQHKQARMDPSLLGVLEAQLLPTLIELHPTNLGEPFAWPHFQALCQAMQRNGVVLDLTTNGTLLTPDRLEWIAPIARDIKVSFDGATPETFERLRRGARFATVCENVRALAQRLRRVPTRKPIVALQMTLMRSNFRELPALIRLGASLGVDRVKAYHLFSFRPELDAEVMAGVTAEWDAVLAEAEGIGEELGIDLQLAEPAQLVASVKGLQTSACHLPWHESCIDTDGAVLVCHSHGGDVAGRLNEQPFEAIWNGPLYRQIRAAYAAGSPTWNCRGCGMNLEKSSEHQRVPYDPESFLSQAGRAHQGKASPVRWSGRMKQFDLIGRRTFTSEEP